MHRSWKLWGGLALLALVLGSAPGGTAWAGDLAELEARFEAAQKEKGAQGAFDSFREEFATFARDNAGTEAGLGAELWLLRMHWWQRSEGTMQKNAGPFARRLVKEYGQHAALKRIPEFSYLFSAEDFQEIVRELSEVTPHREVKAECLYSLARKLKRSEPDEAREIFTRLKREYGDVPYRYITYGEIAAAHLAPHDPAKLTLGERAPEIVGVDVHGEPMKLSDYRGKVVVLDFWGDW